MQTQNQPQTSNSKELTLTRALVELKLYDSKIQKAINELRPTSFSVNGVVVDYRQTIEEFTNNYNSQIQKIKDLRNNKSLLKNALMEANASTKVKIGNKEYTILEALNKKADIQIENEIVRVLKQSVVSSNNRISNITDQIESNIEQTINSKSASSGNQSKDYIQSVRDSYKSQLPQPVNIEQVEKLILEKEAEIAEFLAEVDFALSEVNATTKITVNLA